MRSDKTASSQLKDQEQVNIELCGFKQSELSKSPIINILEDNSTIQTKIFTQNADELLVDLTIGPNSPKGEIGLAFVVERTPLKSSIDKEVDAKAAINEDI